jgi:hypothetical protein
MRVFGDLLSFTRRDILRDTEQPYLWSDEALCECIAQAHDEFAERTLTIRDSSSIAAVFSLEEGVDLYPLHATVQAVLSAKVDGELQGLIRASASSLDGYVPPPDVITWLERINNGTAQDGTPLAFTTDDSVEGEDQSMVIRVYPTPAAADAGREVKMRVARLPLVQCSTDTLDETVECNRQFLMGLCHGAAAIAYSMNDADGNDPTKAEKQRAKFEEYVARAKATARRKLFTPLSWGFGRGGFTHSR